MIINTNNIKQDQVIKNYKELCELLEIKPTTSSIQRERQLEEIQQYCKFEKQGHKFIIKEIYNKPSISLNDLSKAKNAKYIKLVANILVEYLYKNPTELQQVPLIKLFTILGITNSNYSSANRYRKELSQLYDIQSASIQYFFSNTRNEFKKVVERCLNNLQNRRVMNWNRCVIVVDNKNETVYKADEEKQKIIINKEKDILQEMKYMNMYQLMQNKKDFKKFNDRVHKELGFSYYYAYDLIIGDIALEIEYKNVQRDKQELNNLIIDKTEKMFDKEFFSDYQEDYSLLISLLVDEQQKEIINEMLKDKYVENFNNYVTEAIEESKAHDEKMKELKGKYLDD